MKTQILLRKTIEGKGLGLGLGLDLFHFILNSPQLICDVTYSILYLDGKNTKWKCQMNKLQKKSVYNHALFTIHAVWHAECS